MPKAKTQPRRVMRLGEPIGETKRTVEDLIAVNTDAVEMAKTLTDTEVEVLIDEAQRHDSDMKAAEKKLKPMKALLMEHAKLKEWKTRAGAKAICTIKPSTTTEIEPLTLLRKITELGKKALFPTLFKVKITDAKAYLGKEEIAEIAKVNTEKYGSVSLKEQ